MWRVVMFYLALFLVFVLTCFKTLARAQNKTFHIGVMVPLTGSNVFGQEIVASAYLAVQRVNSDPQLKFLQDNGYNFSLTIKDTGCDVGLALMDVVDLYKRTPPVDTIIGPYCDEVCETTGLLIGRFALPMISYGCEESSMLDKQKYPTFLRTSVSFKSMAGFLQDVMSHFGWTHIVFVTFNSRVWLETEAEILAELSDSALVTQTLNIDSSDWQNLTSQLQKVGANQYIFLLLMDGSDVLQLMKAANELKLMDGEHVFVSVDYSNLGKRVRNALSDVYVTGLMDITLDTTPESQVYKQFVQQIIINSTVAGSSDGCYHYELATQPGLLHDGILHYANAVNRCFLDGSDPREGDRIVSHLYDATVEGVTGKVHIQLDGSREGHFMVSNLQNGCYVPVARSADNCTQETNGLNNVKCLVTQLSGPNTRGRAFVYMNNTVIWPGGSNSTPIGRPSCGWDNSYCQESSPVVLASLSTIGAVLLVSILCGLIIWRVRLNRLESSLSWVIHIDDLRLKEKGLARSTTYLDNTNTSNMSGSSGSLASIFTESSYGQVFAEQYIYKNEEVASKKVILKGKQSFIITKEISKDVNHVIELTHANICKFYGICVDAGSEMSIWEYCRKGSLQDVIHNDKKYLDDMPFKISFMNDICKGLRYLHHSHLGRHGRLKASNVLVDNRWTCKLTHVMIPSLASVEVTDGDFTNHEGHLSTAPEVLRNPDLAISGTKAADVYSFGIILLEIFTVSEVHESFNAAFAQEQAVEKYKTIVKKRHNHHSQHSHHHMGQHHHHHSSFLHHSHHSHHHSHHSHGSSVHHHGGLGGHHKRSSQYMSIGLFASHNEATDSKLNMDETIDAKEIIERLKKGGNFPFRPLIPEYVDRKTRNMITACWHELADVRPSIDHIASLVRNISQQFSGKNKSLMEQMLDKVTREADMQAQELQEEKNKSDLLLYQMLPATVADCLKRQIEVKPETFQSATVYFSDIQGFTELSSVSEPIEIVNFLNDVYYKFDNILDKYNVYKVETIGDAYVVCSGVPVRVEKHATEIGKMALHILMSSAELKVHHRPAHTFHMRIGLHSGPVAAGVVGRTMPRYCLFGDTVNTASRMESTGVPGKIQISEQCKSLLDADGGFYYEPRTPFHVKVIPTS
ncbi:atrial natriuretic peptide receptor 1 [Biomphalaria glabrata]|nr:atrial natriuretic peptide receptor 1 [Biomphalaria glabrata]